MIRAIILITTLYAYFGGLACADEGHELLTVRNPQQLPARIAVTRTPLGEVDDYKPSLVALPDGDLLLVAFHQVRLEGSAHGPIREEVILFRSGNNGETWSPRQTLSLLGREPYFSINRQGTLFLTGHLLARDVRNEHGYLLSYLHRSADGGRSWDSIPIPATDLPGAPEKVWTHTSRGVLELDEGTLILGVSALGGHDYLWRSHDDGRTWDRSLECKFKDFDTSKLQWPIFAETTFWQAISGDLLALFRMDPKVLPADSGSEVCQTGSDQFERLVVLRSTDGGENWKLDLPLGSVCGEMYPAILRLGEGRLLLTFTVRAQRPPLGVHAVLGRETPDGFQFDFKHDHVVIDAKTPVDMKSGGGFGPTVRLQDGTLATAYSYRDEDNKTHLEVARWKLP